jgi:two-component sensor histidine kinase
MQKMLGLSFFFLLLFHQGNAKNTISYDEVESVNGCSQDLDTNLFILKKISIDQYQNMDEVNSTVLTVMANERNNRNLALQKVISKSLLYLIGIELFLIIIPIIYVGYRNKITANRKLENLQKETDPKNYSINELLMEKDKLLIERDWLLTEVQHRVKNNLQIITSLLNSQSAFLKNESALYAIRESKNRIEAISLIYQKLYDSNNISVVNMPNYIVELINSGNLQYR